MAVYAIVAPPSPKPRVMVKATHGISPIRHGVNNPRLRLGEGKDARRARGQGLVTDKQDLPSSWGRVPDHCLATGGSTQITEPLHKRQTPIVFSTFVQLYSALSPPCPCCPPSPLYPTLWLPFLPLSLSSQTRLPSHQPDQGRPGTGAGSISNRTKTPAFTVRCVPHSSATAPSGPQSPKLLLVAKVEMKLSKSIVYPARQHSSFSVISSNAVFQLTV